jgi:hypothetical protein
VPAEWARCRPWGIYSTGAFKIAMLDKEKVDVLHHLEVVFSDRSVAVIRRYHQLSSFHTGCVKGRMAHG